MSRPAAAEEAPAKTAADEARRLLRRVTQFGQSGPANAEPSNTNSFQFRETTESERLAERVAAMDTGEKIKLARSLADFDHQTAAAILTALTHDDDESIRTAALEAMQTFKPTASLRQRVMQMADSDPSALVKGYARLLTADWKLEASHGGNSSKVLQANHAQPQVVENESRGGNRSEKITTHALRSVRPYWDQPGGEDDWASNEIAGDEIDQGGNEHNASPPTKAGTAAVRSAAPSTIIAGPLATIDADHGETTDTAAQAGFDDRKNTAEGPLVREGDWPTQRGSDGDDVGDESLSSWEIPRQFDGPDAEVGNQVLLVPDNQADPTAVSSHDAPVNLLLDSVASRESIVEREPFEQQTPGEVFGPALLEAPSLAANSDVSGSESSRTAATEIDDVFADEGAPAFHRLLPAPTFGDSNFELSELNRQPEELAPAPQETNDTPEILEFPDTDESPEPRSKLERMFVTGTAALFGAFGLDLRRDPGAPLGFSGPSGVQPTEVPESPHFAPVEDRWRIGFPAWDRYESGNPPVTDYPYVEGHWWDPYNQNVLKGDYPIIGQHTFLNITATSLMLHEAREVPTATTPFESTVRPFQEEFFGDPFQYFYTHLFSVRFDLFHGSAAFKPFDWQIRLTPVFNINYLDVNELAVVNPDVRAGTTRFRDDTALEEWFVEAKLADLGPGYDFASIRAGSQLFVSDFRGFIFADVNRAVRLFGTRLSNRDQFNLIFFDQTDKETNSELNLFDDRHQNVFIANYFRQDFVVPGYTLQSSFHYNNDQPSFEFDQNDFLVRPDPSGVFREHEIDAYYFGIAGDGHFGRYNISHAHYWVWGEDSLNPIASRDVEIDAHMTAVEFSYDRDWIRFRTSYLWASGDDVVNDDRATGFDAIFDNPNFAGGEFSYWQRQAIRLFGVNLTQRKSIVPNMRSSKTQGQSNFVNPGLHLYNIGMDVEVTPKLKLISNCNFLWFDTTRVLETFTFQDKIDAKIGTDLSLGIEFRPFLNDNVQIIGGLAWLFPEAGMDDLFGTIDKSSLASAINAEAPTMFSHFLEVILIF